MSFEIGQDRPQPLHLVMQSHRMFEQFFALIGHQIDHGIGAEREHPIAGKQAEQGADTQQHRGKRQADLRAEDQVQPGKLEAMLQHGRQAAAVDFFLARKTSEERETIAKERTEDQFLGQAVALRPCIIRWRLNEEPGCQAGATVVGHGGVQEMKERMGAGYIEIVGIEVVWRRLEMPWRNVGPVQVNSGDVGSLDLLP
jgi:hypothetical protein